MTRRHEKQALFAAMFILEMICVGAIYLTGGIVFGVLTLVFGFAAMVAGTDLFLTPLTEEEPEAGCPRCERSYRDAS